MSFFNSENEGKFFRNYSHFDYKTKLLKHQQYIEKKSNIKHHPFFPFIKNELDFDKYHKKTGIKTKRRTIMYASHIDRYIYQYYSYKLNNKYNRYINEKNFEEVVTAYRTNLGKNNIDFAKEVFDYISKQKKCLIMVGDFEKFFDKINHKKLYDSLCRVLACDRLDEDEYSVYKSITKYSYVDMSTLIEFNNLVGKPFNDLSEMKQKEVMKKFNKLTKALSTRKFKELRRNNKTLKIINKNPDNFGIPQGSPISAVLSNVYMINFDMLASDFSNQNGGLYRRYSDDFIFIVPYDGKSNSQNIESIREFFSENSKNSGVELQDEKTNYYIFDSENIYIYDNKTKTSEISFLDYLGFTFDGKTIKIREKTVSKYYYRLYRQIKKIKYRNGYINNKKYKYQTRREAFSYLYRNFSIKGAYPKANNKNGNFITYILKSEKIMGQSVSNIPSVHMKKIKKRLK